MDEVVDPEWHPGRWRSRGRREGRGEIYRAEGCRRPAPLERWSPSWIEGEAGLKQKVCDTHAVEKKRKGGECERPFSRRRRVVRCRELEGPFLTQGADARRLANCTKCSLGWHRTETLRSPSRGLGEPPPSSTLKLRRAAVSDGILEGEMVRKPGLRRGSTITWKERPKVPTRAQNASR